MSAAEKGTLPEQVADETLAYRLAAATELLRRARNGFDWNQYDDAEQNQIGRDLDAFLAGARDARPSGG